MTALRRVALPFDGGADKTKQSQIRGGKGMSLAEMVALGLPVPLGFTLVTGVWRAYRQHGYLPRRVLGQIEREMKALESVTGRRFGDAKNPLLVSVRSGAEVSMPGMMETILNVGINPRDLSGLIRDGGEQFAYDTKSRFELQWAEVADSVPEDPFEQLFVAISAVLDSWESELAIAYREKHGISHDVGTAINVQQMVFGNADQQSCTGVVFSANPITGQTDLFGEFLVRAQGEDVVSGVRQTLPITQLSVWNESVGHSLEGYVRQLEAHYSCAVDVEFTVERGVLYLLQVRPAKLAPQARLVRAVRKVWQTPRRERVEALRRVVASTPPSAVDVALRPVLSDEVVTSQSSIASGLSASPGVVSGIVTRSIVEAQALAKEGRAVVLVRPETSPHDLPGMLVSCAIVTGAGGPSCHAAIVARDLAIPAVVGSADIDRLLSGTVVTVDGNHGLVFAGELTPVNSTVPHEVKVLQGWVEKSQEYVPRVDLKYLEEKVSSTTLLADYYLTDMMATAARGTKLEIPAWVLRERTHREVAERLATYLLVAVSAEARHYWSNTGNKTDQSDQSAKYINRRLYLKSYSNRAYSGRRLSQQAVVKFARTHEHATICTLVEHIKVVFTRADWCESYGGAAWAAIARCLLRFFRGEISPSVFADQTFDLRHNGNKLFDKHPMIREGNWLKELLNAKRDAKTVQELQTACLRFGAAASPATVKFLAAWEKQK